ncbi:MAG: hypothetical protein KKA90_03805 [Nanoarchaeota archaeon]|nr:hypothetical protein [Nanoarchaeota archaeon]
MKRCPVCKGTDITLMIGGITGKFQCRCGYQGPLVIEDEKGVYKKKGHH